MNPPATARLVAPSWLGPITLLWGEHALVGLALGDPEAVAAGLPELAAADARRRGWAAAAMRQVADPAAPPAALPLRLAGTPFQQRVWRALAGTRPGQVVTYQDLAQSLGCPRGARAVAGACAANPCAILVPCHRVVRADGGLGGFRWGLERKRRLLARERAALPAAPARPAGPGATPGSP